MESFLQPILSYSRDNHGAESLLNDTLIPGKIFEPYPADGCLYDGIKATLRYVEVGRDALLGDDLFELVGSAGQRQAVFVAERRQAGYTRAVAVGQKRANKKRNEQKIT